MAKEPRPITVADAATDQVIARYRASTEWWTDVLEAAPRCRIRVNELPDQIVEVLQGGQLKLPENSRVEVDVYDDYPDMRDEVIHGG